MKISSKTPEKEAPQGNVFEFFLLDVLKATFWMENLTRPFFQKLGHFFSIFKKARGDLPSPSPLVERLWVWMNIHQYPWISLNTLENARINCCVYARAEYAWSSYIFDRLLKMPRDLNKAGFWIWHGCIRKGYAEFLTCLIMAPYASIMPEYSSVCLNITQYDWTWLNITECHWVCLKMSE